MQGVRPVHGGRRQEKAEDAELRVSFDDFYRCPRCSKLIQAQEARYLLYEAPRNVRNYDLPRAPTAATMASASGPRA